ncbi:type II toxin-antitoxin system RelE/ParE family toxin [Mesorhizobium ephedrae]|uniref:Type II toxin-antitoxin system RelE/ParE family toxin n=1 Tax=Kumtagia ephedrae TaxID=2116701 RepID=A0A2P7S7I7_9HYPH|nr:type II toxin-antitoxin system RelE/ParE family toxin [Mesorhizobium ephedrae]
MARLRYTDAARADIADITLYIARETGSRRVAENFREQIHQKCRHLATLPGSMGRPRPELRADLRSVAFKNYVIFFRYRDDVFEVVDVMAGHRDIEDYFGGDET